MKNAVLFSNGTRNSWWETIVNDLGQAWGRQGLGYKIVAPESVADAEQKLRAINESPPHQKLLLALIFS